jgi:hypothetical protein
VPLVAESQVAAFYPPNWILYGSRRFHGIPTGHVAALPRSGWRDVFLARRLGGLPWGAALAALLFTLCGSQVAHASHEWLYSALPFLPLALLFADRWVIDGERAALSLLPIDWGAQLTLGHFQIQRWTAVLVIFTAGWRLLEDGRPRRRALGLVGALALGGGLAAVQLVLSWDYAHFVGATQRPIAAPMFYSYPPAHWTELGWRGLAGRLRRCAAAAS